jgi:fibronectin-binding autotransporter adhesin
MAAKPIKTGLGAAVFTAPGAIPGDIVVGAGSLYLARSEKSTGVQYIVTGDVFVGNGSDDAFVYCRAYDYVTPAAQQLNYLSVLRFQNSGYLARFDTYSSTQSVKGITSSSSASGSVITSGLGSGLLNISPGLGDDYSYTGAISSNHIGKYGLGIQRLNSQTGVGLSETIGNVDVYAGSLIISDTQSFKVSAFSVHKNGVFQIDGSTDFNQDFALTNSGRFIWNSSGTWYLNSPTSFYSGPIDILNGVAKIINSTSFGVGGGLLTIGSGATLDLNGYDSSMPSKPVLVSGSGYQGLGAVFNSSGSLGPNSMRSVRMSGNATFNSVFGIGLYETANSLSGGFDMGGFDLTKIGPGYLQLRYTSPVDNPGNILVNAGQLRLIGYTDLGPATSKSITLSSEGTLVLTSLLSRNRLSVTMLNGSRITSDTTTNSWYGNLSISGIASIMNSSVYRHYGAISGSGTLIKGDTANLYFLGDGSGFSGTLRSDQGTLMIGRNFVDANENIGIESVTGSVGPNSKLVVNGGIIGYVRTDDTTLDATIEVNSGSFIVGSTLPVVPAVHSHTTINGSVDLYSTSSFSITSGHVTFSSGTISTASVNRSIVVNTDGVLRATGAYSSLQQWLSSDKIGVSSSGVIAIGSDISTDVDMGLLSGLSVGAYSNSEISGVIKPFENTYRLGGGGATLLVSSAITGPSTLTIGTSTGVYASAGSVVLSGLNTFSGGTRINGGSLTFLNAGSLPFDADLISIASGGSLVATGAHSGLSAWVSSGRISTSSDGAIAISSDSSDVVDLSAYPNLLIGATQPSSLNSASLTVGTRYRFGGGGSTLTVNTQLTGSRSVTIGSSNSSGIVVLAGSNSYSGSTTINFGTLRIGSSSALGSSTGISLATRGSTLDLNGYSVGVPLTVTISGVIGRLGLGSIINSSSTPGAITGSIALGTNPITIGGTGAISLDRIFGTAQTIVTKIGASQLSLDGGTNNSSLNLVINGGVVVLNKASSSSVHAIEAGSTFVNGSGVLKLSGSGGDQIEDSAVIWLDNGGTLDMAGQSETVGAISSSTGTLSGKVTNSVAALSTLTFNTGSSNGVFHGDIEDGSGTVAVAKTNTGIMFLAGNNTFTGGISVTAGTLHIGHASNTGTIPSGTQVTVGINGLFGISKFTDYISDCVISGEGGFTKVGGGTLTLTGSSIYTGTTTVNLGTLKLGSNSAIGAASGAIILGGGHLDLNGFSVTKDSVTSTLGADIYNNAASTTSTLTLSSSVNSTFNGTLHDGLGVIAFTKSGSNVLSIGGNNYYTGNTTVTAGTLKLESGRVFSPNSSVTILSGGSIDLNGNGHSQSQNGSRSFTITVSGQGDSFNSSVGAITNSNSTATLGSYAGIKSVVLTGDTSFGGNGNRFDMGLAYGTREYGTITTSGGVDYTFTKVGTNTVGILAPTANVHYVVAGGTLSLEEYGTSAGLSVTVHDTGTLTSYGNLTFVAPLVFESGSTLATLGSPLQDWSGPLTANGSFTVATGPASIKISGAISGSGSIAVTGSHFLRLSGDNSNHSGGISVNASSSLSLESASALGSGASTWSTSGTLDNLSGSAVTTNTTGSFNLDGNLTFLGSNPLSFGSGITTILSGPRTISVTGSHPISIIGEIQGSFGVTKRGSGILNLSGINTFTGGFTLSPASGSSSGLCVAFSSSAFGSGVITASAITGSVSGQIQLSGGIDIPNNIIMTGIGRDQSAPYNYGNLRSIAGSNTLSGLINVTSGGGSSVLSAANGSSLTIGGGVTTDSGPRAISLVGTGTINVTSSIYDTINSISLSVGLLGNSVSGYVSGALTVAEAAAGSTQISLSNTYGFASGQKVFLGANVTTIVSVVQNSHLVVDPALSVSVVSAPIYAYGYTIGSNVITCPAGVPIVEGQLIYGPGIPPNTTIVSYENNTSLTLSNPVSSDITGPITVGPALVPTNNVNLAYSQSTFTGRFTAMGGSVVNISALANVGLPSSIGAGSVLPNPLDVIISGATLSYTGAVATSTDRLFVLGHSGATLNASGSDALSTFSFTSPPSIAPVVVSAISGLSGSRTITVGDTTGIAVGQKVTGTGIIAGSRVSSLVLNTSITLNTALSSGVSGSLTFTNPDSIATDMGYDGDRVLSFTGINTGYNVFAPIITDVTSGFTGTVSVVKSGVGRWILTGSNTYTGITSITAGILGLDGYGAISSGGSVAVTGSSTSLRLYSPTSSVLSPITLTDGSIDNSGTISSIAAASGTITNNFGGSISSLNITGATFSNSGSVTNLTASAGSLTSYGGSAISNGTIGGTSKLTVYGNTSSSITVNSGATLYGSGSLSSITSNADAVISPGDQSNTPFGQLSTTSINLAGGSYIDIEALDPSSSNSRDSIRFTASSSFPASGTVGVRIFSCTNTGARGTSPSFSPNVNYAWPILIDGNNGANSNKVNASKFTLDYSGWQNSNGVWSILTEASAANAANFDLVLKYVPTNTLIYVLVSGDELTSTKSAITGILATDGVEKAGSGKLIFDYNSVYEGGTLVSGGSIALVNGGAIGTGSVVLAAGTTVLHEKTDSSVPNAFAGSGALVKNTAGTSTLSGAVSFDTVNVSSGTLRISNSASIASSTTVGSGGTLSGLSASTISYGALSVTGSVVNAPSSTASTVLVNANGSYSSESGAVLIASGNVVNSGTMNVGGITTSGTFTSNGSTTATGTISSTTVTVNSSGSLSAGAISLNGALANSGTISVTGSVSVTTSVTQTVGSYSSGSLNNTGTLTVTGGSFTVSGAGTLITGNVSVTDATLSAPLDLPSNKTVTLNNGTLNINSSGTTINYAPISGSGSLNMIGTGSAVHAGSLSFGTIGVSSGSLTMNGVITSGIGITKSGVGSLTLNSSYSYSGNSTDASSTISGMSSVVGILPGLSVTGLGIPPNTTVSSVGVSSIVISANATRTGSTLLTFGNVVTGSISINNGNLTIKDAAVLGSGSSVNVSTGGTLNLGGSSSADSISLLGKTITIAGSGISNSGAISNTGAYSQKFAINSIVLNANATIAGSSRWDIYGTSTVTSSINLAGFSLTSLSSYTCISNCIISAGTLISSSGTLEFLNVTAGTDVTIVNKNLVALSTNETSSFRATFDCTDSAPKSVLITGTGGTGGNITLGGGVTTVNTSSFDYVLSGNIGEVGSGVLTKVGSGALDLQGSSNWSGGLNVIAGKVLGSSATAFGTGTVSFPSGSTGSVTLAGGLSYSNSFTIGSSSSLPGAGSSGLIERSGTGVATISGVVTVNSAVLSGSSWVGGASIGDELSFSGALNVVAVTATQGSGRVKYSGGGSSSNSSTLAVSGIALNGALNGLPKIKYVLGVSESGTLDLNGFNAAVFSVTKGANSAIITNDGASDAVLTIDASTSDITYSGLMQDGAKKLGISKIGNSTLNITGTVNSTGTFSINAGSVHIPHTATVSSSSTFSIGGSGTLRITTSTASMGLGSSISGSGVLNLVGNSSYGDLATDFTLTGGNSSFSGQLNLITLDGGLTGSVRLSVTAASQVGTATINVPLRTQLYLSNTTITNNLFISGQGYGDDVSLTGTPYVTLGLSGPAGLGALRADNSTISGNIRIVGYSKIGNSGGTSTTISGNISATNPWEALVFGGQGSYDSTFYLTGTNNSINNLLGIIAVNSGGWVDDTAVRISTLNVGNGGTTGTLGYGGNTQLYADDTSGACLRIFRSDGYSIPVSVNSTYAGSMNNLINNISVVSDTTGTGFAVSGTISIASVQTSQGVTTVLGGGTVYVGKSVNDSKMSVGFGGTVRAGSVKVGSESSAVSGTYTNDGGTTSLYNDLSVGNFPGVVSTMNMSGGSLSIDFPGGYVSVGSSAVGILNHSGGTIKTGWVKIATGTPAEQGGIKSAYYLSGGVLDFTTNNNGVTTDNPSDAIFRMSGGTLRCSVGQYVPITTNLSVTGTGSTVDLKTWGFQVSGSTNLIDGSLSVVGGGLLLFTTETSQSITGAGTISVANTSSIGFNGPGVKTFSIPISGSGKIQAQSGTTILTAANNLDGVCEVLTDATLKVITETPSTLRPNGTQSLVLRDGATLVVPTGTNQKGRLEIGSVLWLYGTVTINIGGN